MQQFDLSQHGHPQRMLDDFPKREVSTVVD
jgi:hypothetical protein